MSLCHHDHPHGPAKRRMLLHNAANLPAVTAGHHHIEQDDRRTYGLEQGERLVTAMRHGDWIPAHLKVLSNDLGVVVVIVDHQDRW